MLTTPERVAALRRVSLFAATPDRVLADVARVVDEFERIRDCVVRLLGLLHEPGAIRQCARGLASGGDARPLALETLVVTVGRHEARRALAVLDPLLEDDRWVLARCGPPVEGTEVGGRALDLA